MTIQGKNSIRLCLISYALLFLTCFRALARALVMDGVGGSACATNGAQQTENRERKLKECTRDACESHNSGLVC